MKNTVRYTFAFSALLALFAHTLPAQVALPFYEPFPLSYTNSGTTETTYFPQGGPDYLSVRIRTGDSATVWSMGGGSGNGSPLILGPAALSYPGLGDPAAPQSAGLYVRTNNTTGGRTCGALFQAQTEGSVYASFLLNVEEAPALNSRLIAQLSSLASGSSSSSLLGIWIDTASNLAITKNTSSSVPVATTPAPLSPGTHLVVARYTLGPFAGDDEVALWVDPDSLGVPEANVPVPLISGITGTDGTSLSSFYIYHPSTEEPASFIMDEVRVGLTWASVTPTGAVCNAAFIVTDPSDTSVVEGLSADLSVVAGGTTPEFQWQISQDGGTSWSAVTEGRGFDTATYSTLPLGLADSGAKYRCKVSVACGGGSSITSSVATVTVTPAAKTALGVVMDDLFDDFVYNNLPYDVSNSVWFASDASTIDATFGNLFLTPLPGTSTLWLGYFTDDSITNLPVHLDVGRGLKMSLVFKATSIVTNNNGLRIGLYDYADGGTRVIANGFGSGSTGNGENVRGYMLSLNFGQTYTDSTPLDFYARTVLPDRNLMGTTAFYTPLGSGPGDMSGASAYQEGTEYTLEITIARQSQTSVGVTANVTGGGTNWTYSVTDNTYAYPRFDAIGIRTATAETSASQFEVSRFLVEVIEVAPVAEPLSITASGADVTLTWSNPAFTLQAAPDATGTYTNVAGAASPYTVPASETRKFYRLIWP